MEQDTESCLIILCVMQSRIIQVIGVPINAGPYSRKKLRPTDSNIPLGLVCFIDILSIGIDVYFTTSSPFEFHFRTETLSWNAKTIQDFLFCLS